MSERTSTWFNELDGAESSITETKKGQSRQTWYNGVQQPLGSTQDSVAQTNKGEHDLSGLNGA